MYMMTLIYEIALTMPGSSISMINDDGNDAPLDVDKRSNSDSAIYAIIS